MGFKREQFFYITDTIRRAPFASAGAVALSVTGIGMAISIGLAPQSSEPSEGEVIRSIQKHPFHGPAPEAPLETADAVPLAETFGTLGCFGSAIGLGMMAVRRAGQSRFDDFEIRFTRRLRGEFPMYEGVQDIVDRLGPPKPPRPPQMPDGIA